VKLSSANIPQADRLEDVIRAAEAVHSGARTFQEIAEYIGKVERQGRYYRLAAEILGLITKEGQNNSKLTKRGAKFFSVSIEERQTLLPSIVLGSRLFQRMLPLFELHPQGITRAEIQAFMTEVTEPASPVTINRRVETVISWLSTVDLLDRRGEEYFLASNYVEKVPFIEFTTITEPMLPKTMRLKEYTTVEKRARIAAKSLKIEVDQTKRERANQVHRHLVNLVAERVRRVGVVPRYNKLIDLMAGIEGQDYIFEMKSITRRNTYSQILRGFSQLYAYRRLQASPKAILVLVVERPLLEDTVWLQALLEIDSGVRLLWDGNNELYASSKTREELAFLW
jgi:hypothetical protein